MKQEERIKAFALRCQGMTWAQIGEVLNYNEQTVSKSIYRVIKKQPRRTVIRYPRLSEYIHRQCGGSVTVFAKRMGVSPYRLRQVLVHGQPASQSLREKIQAETGLTPEEAFFQPERKGEVCR